MDPVTDPIAFPDSAIEPDRPAEPTAAEVRAVVGSNAPYYLRAWAGPLAGRPGGTGFNWAAFLFAGLWLPYRRLYAHALVLYALILGTGVVVDLAAAAQPPGSDAALGFFAADLALGFVVAVVAGLFGNRWYLNRVRRVVAEVRDDGLSGRKHLDALAARGGTNVLALFAFPIAAVVVGAVLDVLVFGAG